MRKMPKLISYDVDACSARFDNFGGSWQWEGMPLNVGDILLLYELGEELFDPDTKQSLGCIEKVLWKAEVTDLNGGVFVKLIEKYNDFPRKSDKVRYKLANREIMSDTSKSEEIRELLKQVTGKETTTEHIEISHVAGMLLMLSSVFKIVDISEQLIKSTMVWDMGAL